MALSRILFLFFLFITSTGWTQTNRYFVFFKDKNGTPFTTSQPEKFLTQKAIQRRLLHSISITTEDLPVNPSYVQQVKSVGVKTFFTSKWWNGVLIEADNSLLTQIRNLSFVSKVDLVAPGTKLLGGRTKQQKQTAETSAIDPLNQFQLQMIGLDDMHQAGFRGEGISVAIFDSGFIGVNSGAPFQHLFTEGRIKSTYNFVHNASGVFSYDDHGTHVFSVIAGSSDSYSGGAPKANFYLFKTEDVPSEYRIEEYNWTFAAERADSLGIDVINSSLGYNTFDDATMDYTISALNGKTTVISNAARKAIEKGIAVVVSAGNEGNNSWKFVTAPADVDGILAIGSVTTSNTKSSFSSIGATADGRIKPDVVALGSGTSIVRANGTVGTANGTSTASPLVASLAIGLLQKYPGLSVSELYQAIIHSADQFFSPDNLKGYGLPDFTAACNYIDYLKRPVLTEELNIYPNPVYGDSFKIVFKEPAGESVTIAIHSATGAEIFKQTLEVNWQNNPIEFDLSKYAAGTYLVNVKTLKTSRTIRLVRQ